MAKTLYDRVNEIKTRHLSPQSVTGEKIPINTIEEKHIANQAVRLRHLGPDVPAIGIADGSVTESKLAANSVVSGKIKAGAVGASELVAGAVGTTKIADGAVTNDKLAQGIDGAKIIDGSVALAKLASVPKGIALVDPQLLYDGTLADFQSQHSDNMIDLAGSAPDNAGGAVVSIRLYGSASSVYLFTSMNYGPLLTVEGDLTLAGKLYLVPFQTAKKILVSVQGYETGTEQLTITLVGWF